MKKFNEFYGKFQHALNYRKKKIFKKKKNYFKE